MKPTQRKPSHCPDSGQFHAVRFFKDAHDLCDIVGSFLVEGFHSGQAAIVVATPDHRRELTEWLRRKSLDVDQLLQSGALTVKDAAETLQQFMIDGMPDPGRFRRVMEPIIAAARSGRPDGTVRVYGEMVNILWQSGHTAAAIRLETQWNSLASLAKFSLTCGYAMGNFYKDSDVEDICECHSHVIGGEARAPVAADAV
jgi:hypothetical protein